MENIISYILSPELIQAPWSILLTILEIVFLIISFFFLLLIFFVLLKSKRLSYRFIEDIDEFIKFKPHEINKLAKNWKLINKKIETGIESEYKLAIIEADVMLEDVLKRMGHTEETIEKKLNATTSSEIENIEEIKEARKVRNNVVYDPDFELTLDKTKETLKVYEKTFRNLNVLS